jgi:hypothetical protein
MKSTFSKWSIILCAGILALGLGACKQSQEPVEEEVEVEQVETAPAQDTANDMTDETANDMTEESVEMSVQESDGSGTEVEETVEETVDTVQDSDQTAPDTMPEDSGQDSGQNAQ